MFIEKEDENLHSLVNFCWFSKYLPFLEKIQAILDRIIQLKNTSVSEGKPRNYILHV